MSALKRIFVASDLSPRADRALGRAAGLARIHGARLTALHVVESLREAVGVRGKPPAPTVSELVAQAKTEARSMFERRLRKPVAHIDVRTGKAFVEIVRQARAARAELVVLGAHGRHFVRDLFLGTTAERVVRKGGRAVLVVKRPPGDSYRRVLVPVDFSATARATLLLTARLAPMARLILLHAYEIPYEGRLRMAGATNEPIARLRRQHERQARARLRALVRELKLGARHPVCLVHHGYPSSVIDAAARARRADLVALGTHGMSGLRYVLLGSVAERVLREAPCDVLVVPPKAVRFTLP